MAYRILIGRETLRDNLVMFPMIKFDAMLAMDWLSMLDDLLDYHEKKVLYSTPRLSELVIHDLLDSGMRLILTLQSMKLISKRCDSFMAFFDVSLSNGAWVFEIIVVTEFFDFFPKDLPSFSPAREIEFNINLVIITKTISKALYCMAPTEMAELKL